MNFIEQIRELKALQNRDQIALSFDSKLEGHFVAWLQQQQESMARIVIVIICAIWVLFIVSDFVRLSGEAAFYRDIPMLDLILWIRIPVFLFLCLIAFWILRIRNIAFPKLIITAYFVLSLAAAVLSNIYQEHGVYKSGWIPVVLIVPLFILPIGMLFRQALGLGVAVVIALVSTYLLMIDTSQDNQFKVYFLSLFICFLSGAAGGYFQEKGLREAFIALKMFELRAFTDPLTELGNRRYFREFGERLLRDAERHESTLVFSIIDIDWFKRINDDFGHEFGDQVLTKFAEQIRHSIRRPLDIAVRLGGEEFGILFPDTTPEQAMEILQQLKESISRLNYQAKGVELQRLKVSFSAGVCLAKPGDTLEALYKRADENLYRAKDAGRDQIYI